MIDPTTIATLLKAAAEAKRALDAAALRSAVDDIKASVDGIGKRLAEDVLIEVRSGFDHLAVAIEAVNDDIRRDELGHARQYFGRLANREGGGTVSGTSGSLTGDQVCALGYLGNYAYFLVRGDPRQALISAYLCTERFPVLGVQLFPTQLFSRDYRAGVRSANARGELRSQFHNFAREQWRGYVLEKAWRIPAAGGAVLAGLIGAAVSPPLAGRGVMWATGILAGSEHGMLPPPRPDQRKFLQGQAEEMERALAPLKSEARARRLALEGSSPKKDPTGH
jgi:hypothetical protein